MAFKSERLRLQIQFCPDPQIEAVAHRVHCSVLSLEEVADALDALKYEYQWIRGMQFTDRAISVLDPAGHRVLIRRRYRHIA